jgi:hypothetical protein
VAGGSGIGEGANTPDPGSLSTLWRDAGCSQMGVVTVEVVGLAFGWMAMLKREAALAGGG